MANFWIEIAVIAYCTWQASDLPTAWYGTPSMRWGWLAMLIWCLPILIYFIRRRPLGSNPLLLGMAILSSFLGSIGSLHILQHLGLAFALAALLPLSWPMLIWVPSAASWMSAFGWFARFYPLAIVIVLQIGIALLGTCLMLIDQRQRKV